MRGNYTKSFIIAAITVWLTNSASAAELIAGTIAAIPFTVQESNSFVPYTAFGVERIDANYLPQWLSGGNFAISRGLVDRAPFNNSNGDFETSVSGSSATLLGFSVGVAAERFRLSAFGGLTFDAMSNGFEVSTNSSIPAWTVGGELEIALAQNWTGKAQVFYVVPERYDCADCFSYSPIGQRGPATTGLIGLTYSFSADELPKPPPSPFPTDPRPWK